MNRRRLTVSLTGLALAVMLGAAVLAASAGATAHKAGSGGKLTWCSDITYPPEEFYMELELPRFC